jgi:hypothetical protein
LRKEAVHSAVGAADPQKIKLKHKSKKRELGIIYYSELRATKI